MLCDAYETYGSGLPQALYLLGELSGFAELSAYLGVSARKSSLILLGKKNAVFWNYVS